jgi:hypothetical protein
MEQIKDWFSGVWAKVAAAATILFGIMWYIINLRGKKVNELQAKLDLADTHKKVDLIEVEIKAKLEDNKVLDKERQEYDNMLKALEDKRNNIPKDQSGKTPQQAEEYWNK